MLAYAGAWVGNHEATDLVAAEELLNMAARQKQSNLTELQNIKNMLQYSPSHAHTSLKYLLCLTTCDLHCYTNR